MAATLDFELPADAEATAPPETHGISRDGVRLLVATPSRLRHAWFADLGDFLAAGDLLVVNTSATLPSAVDGWRDDGRPVAVHFSTPQDDGTWVVEVRAAANATGPVADARAGEAVALPAGATLRLLARYRGRRLWAARLDADTDVEAYLSRHGRPITYAYAPGRWPLSAYQTVFARHRGSAEMPSAGRPFTAALVASLVAAGIVMAPVTLHTGVSSLDAGEAPLPERFAVPATTADLVNLTRRRGRRVVAIGTTVARALESAAGPDGTVVAAGGWTDLVLGPDRPARVVTGLVTGWHAPGASHLSLLESVTGRALVAAAYQEAVRTRYLWHEFGDSCLLLPASAQERAQP